MNISAPARGLVTAASILMGGSGFACLAFSAAHAQPASNWTGAVPLDEIPMPSISDRYPVKNDEASIQTAYSSPAAWDGRAVSVEGSVKSFLISPGGRPSIELSLSGSSETTIWATWPMKESDDKFREFLRLGERLRILGWLENTALWSRVTNLNLPGNNSLTLLPVCLVIARNSDAVEDAKFAEYCAGWQKGYMPPNMIH